MDDYDIEAVTVRGRTALVISVDGEEIGIDGLLVEEYYYEDGGERYTDCLMLLSDGVEQQIDPEENVLRLTLGHGEAEIRFPEEFVDDLEAAIEEHGLPEWNSRY